MFRNTFSIIQRALICISLALGPIVASGETASVRLADGFDCPVGRNGTKQYYKARGFRANGHLGEDWNGAGGGDTDLGDPVFAVAHGAVVLARDCRLGWGNVIIVRHAYLEGGQTQFVDSLYGHLHSIEVREGDAVARGQRIGTIGNNHGMYDAHLHFEMRKNLAVGMLRHRFPRDSSVYWDPTTFIAARRTLPGGAMMASIPINTFSLVSAPADAGDRIQSAPQPVIQRTIRVRRTTFTVDRFSDLREESE